MRCHNQTHDSLQQQPHLTGSSIHRNSSVPTADEGNRGVNRKWFAGEITVRGTSLFTFRAILKPPQPLPRTTTLSVLRTAAAFRINVRYIGQVCVTRSHFFGLYCSQSSPDFAVVYASLSVTSFIHFCSHKLSHVCIHNPSHV